MLDEGIYICSPRTLYRLLEEHGEVRERRDQLRRPAYQKPELLATRPNQVWSWDITKLRGPRQTRLPIPLHSMTSGIEKNRVTSVKKTESFTCHAYAPMNGMIVKKNAQEE